MGKTLSFWAGVAKQATKGLSPIANDWQWLTGTPLYQYVAGTSGVGFLVVLRSTFGGGLVATIAETFVSAFAAFGFTWLAAYAWALLRVSSENYYWEKERADKAQNQLSAILDPKKGIWLYDAVYYRLFGIWPKADDRIFPCPGPNFGDASKQRKDAKTSELWPKATGILQNYRQSAHEGLISIWGVSKERAHIPWREDEENDIYQKINPDHWIKYKIETDRLLYEAEAVFTTLVRGDVNLATFEAFYCLKVSKAQIEALISLQNTEEASVSRQTP